MLYKPKLSTFCSHGVFFAEKTIPLQAMVTNCGYQRETHQRIYDWDGMKRGNAEMILWQYTIAGRGKLDYENRSYDLLPGLGMLVHIPHRHRYFLPSDSDAWEFMYICMNGREIIRICRELEKEAGPVTSYDEQSKTPATAEQIIIRAKNTEFHAPYQASLLAYQMGMNLMEDLASAIAKKVNKPDFIKKVSEYCLEHLDEPLTVEDLSEVAGYTRYHFSRLFKAAQGVSPAAFLKELRLRKSVRLLQTERLSIKEIAENCGFESSSYFCRAFQKEYGQSPGAFRSGKVTE